jgi:hypothetical protein
MSLAAPVAMLSAFLWVKQRLAEESTGGSGFLMRTP